MPRRGVGTDEHARLATRGAERARRRRSARGTRQGVGDEVRDATHARRRDARTYGDDRATTAGSRARRARDRRRRRRRRFASGRRSWTRTGRTRSRARAGARGARTSARRRTRARTAAAAARDARARRRETSFRCAFERARDSRAGWRSRARRRTVRPARAQRRRPTRLGLLGRLLFLDHVRLSSSRGRGSAAAMAQPSAKSATAPMNDVIGRVGFGDAGASRARVAVRWLAKD